MEKPNTKEKLFERLKEENKKIFIKIEKS